MKKIKRQFIIFTMFTCLIALFPLVSAAKVPWELQLTLRGNAEIGSMLLPSAVYFDANKDRFYVVDTGNNRLVSFDAEGKVLNTFDAGGSLKTPFDMVRDSRGDFWITEKGRNSLTQINIKTKKIDHYSLEFADREIFPDRLALHNGDLYVLDKASGDIFTFSRATAQIEAFSTCGDCKIGFADFVVKGNSLWALEAQEKTVYEFNLQGKLKKKIRLKGDVVFPFSLAIGASRAIYVLERHRGRVDVFDLNGNRKYNFMGAGHSKGKTYYPEDLYFDSNGRFCVVDSGNGRVEVFVGR